MYTQKDETDKVLQISEKQNGLSSTRTAEHGTVPFLKQRTFAVGVRQSFELL